MENLLKNMRNNIVVVEQEIPRLNENIKQAGVNINVTISAMIKDLQELKKLNTSKRKSIPKRRINPKQSGGLQNLKHRLTESEMTELKNAVKQEILAEGNPIRKFLPPTTYAFDDLSEENIDSDEHYDGLSDEIDTNKITEIKTTIKPPSVAVPEKIASNPQSMAVPDKIVSKPQSMAVPDKTTSTSNSATRKFKLVQNGN